jgi:ATP-dependent RNA helicase RhlE
MKFSELGLNDSILNAIEETGYNEPTPIQAQAIPAIIDGKDVMAAAQTGTGKTAGFTLPILHLLHQGNRAKANQSRALILTPTRELAAQIAESVETYGKNLPLNSTVVFGGVKVNPQMTRLRQGVDILVATPGRLLDLYNQNAVKFDNLEILVLDEADRMLDMGFIHDIKRILKVLPKKRQNLLFSATFSEEIRNLAKGLVNNPIEISVTPRNTTVSAVKQWLVPFDKKSKPALLIKLIKEKQWPQVLVFSRTKHGANRLVTQLDKANIKALAIHGNKSQGARTRALAEFKNLKIQVLVATDIAARGIDIDELPNVVNFDLPNVPEDYIHRIGRTGRAGSTGEAVSLVSADEINQLSDIERLTQKLIDREYIDGFEPSHEVPASNLRAPKKPNKPKKSKSNNSHSAPQKKSNRRDNDRNDKNRGNKNQQKGSNNASKNKSSKNQTSPWSKSS